MGLYRVGKKQKRAILNKDGLEIAIFHVGYESLARKVCDLLNEGVEPVSIEMNINDWLIINMDNVSKRLWNAIAIVKDRDKKRYISELEEKDIVSVRGIGKETIAEFRQHLGGLAKKT